MRPSQTPSSRSSADPERLTRGVAHGRGASPGRTGVSRIRGSPCAARPWPPRIPAALSGGRELRDQTPGRAQGRAPFPSRKDELVRNRLRSISTRKPPTPRPAERPRQFLPMRPPLSGDCHDVSQPLEPAANTGFIFGSSFNRDAKTASVDPQHLLDRRFDLGCHRLVGRSIEQLGFQRVLGRHLFFQRGCRDGCRLIGGGVFQIALETVDRRGTRIDLGFQGVDLGLDLGGGATCLGQIGLQVRKLLLGQGLLVPGGVDLGRDLVARDVRRGQIGQRGNGERIVLASGVSGQNRIAIGRDPTDARIRRGAGQGGRRGICGVQRTEFRRDARQARARQLVPPGRGFRGFVVILDGADRRGGF